VPGSFFAGEILDIDGVTGVLIFRVLGRPLVSFLVRQASWEGKELGKVGENEKKLLASVQFNLKQDLTMKFSELVQKLGGAAACNSLTSNRGPECWWLLEQPGVPQLHEKFAAFVATTDAEC